MRLLPSVHTVLAAQVSLNRENQTPETQVTSPPFYGKTANSFTSPARGWNTFVFQSNPAVWSRAGFDFNVFHFRQHCSKFYDIAKANPDYDYYCSIDSGWSHGDAGDVYGRMQPNDTVWSGTSLQDFAKELNDQNVKLGVYLIPGMTIISVSFSLNSDDFKPRRLQER
jgi:hypothetical protein